MLLKTLAATVLCFASSYVVAMDSDNPFGGYRHSQIGKHSHAQGNRKNPKHTTTQGSSAKAKTLQKAKKDAVTMHDLRQEALLNCKVDQAQQFKELFPNLFTLTSAEEIFPAHATLTQHLQISIVHNNLEQVQECLKAMDLTKTFSKEVAQSLDQAITQATITLDLWHNQAAAALSNNNEIDLTSALHKTLLTIESALGHARKEIIDMTGPLAERCHLTILCNSPAAIEQSSLVQDTDNGDLVIGLCALLRQAHLAKAETIANPQLKEQYLRDHEAINNAVLEAYEKQSHAYERLKKLYGELKIAVDVKRYLTKDQDIQDMYPKMFNNLQDPYPATATITELLQHAMVQNDLEAVKKYLSPEATRAQRCSLLILCGTPAKIEKKLLPRYLDQKVVGLTGLLVDIHALKAKLMPSEDASKKYLRDLATINTLVWQAYESPCATQKKRMNLTKKRHNY